MERLVKRRAGPRAMSDVRVFWWGKVFHNLVWPRRLSCCCCCCLEVALSFRCGIALATLSRVNIELVSPIELSLKPRGDNESQLAVVCRLDNLQFAPK